jgi:hypothetical protein
MTEIKNGKIIHTVLSGTDSAIVLKSSDLPDFDEVRMDIKNVERIQAEAVLSLSSMNSGGIEVEKVGQETKLIIAITNAMTELFKASRLYFDLKFRIGDTVLDLVIPGEIINKQTVTKV